MLEDGSDYKDAVAELLELREEADESGTDIGLTPWELDFLNSMTDWFEKGRLPTEKQRAVIERIYERLMG